jgi:hypothetical protein
MEPKCAINKGQGICATWGIRQVSEHEWSWDECGQSQTVAMGISKIEIALTSDQSDWTELNWTELNWTSIELAVQWDNVGFSLQLPNRISNMEGSKWSSKELVCSIHTVQEHHLKRLFWYREQKTDLIGLEWSGLHRVPSEVSSYGLIMA